MTFRLPVPKESIEDSIRRLRFFMMDGSMVYGDRLLVMTKEDKKRGKKTLEFLKEELRKLS